MILRVAAEVPFAEARRRVTLRLEPRRERGFRKRQADRLIEIPVADRVHLVAEARLIAARHESSARRRAERRRDVAVREADSVARDGVDMRRRDLRIPLAAEFAVAEVVGDQQDDIRLAARLGG